MTLCRTYSSHTFKLTSTDGGTAWNILLIEELEYAVERWRQQQPQSTNLSEQNMPERLIVIATSNDASGLDETLLQRFNIYPFSCGPSFADACADRLNEIWERETGNNIPMPPEVALMGWKKDSYSMRRALSALAVPQWKCTWPTEFRRWPYADRPVLVVRGRPCTFPA